MKVVSDYIHSLGLKAGIYAEAGDNTCGSIYDDDKKGIGSGLYGHEQADMNLFLKDWNYDFIKIDYCGALELGLEEEQRYQTICDAIRQTGRTDVSINICRWAFPGTWAARLARSWRISQTLHLIGIL
ncbi:alpha-galactosidase precursor [Bacteroides pyogenes JCM 6292]|uniref:Alpha-galactosidase n=2 Tax=Bacteroides pyogenes TaxID=310300 RepID=W4PF05_9BACE|nr:alpha-galactosidase precursor [Bacteroides pyogenes JCM 6292]GAE17953.1 alpha-galactosidase precursor [Bacteroides pyogenes DSM 20611 = JCM 6294]